MSLAAYAAEKPAVRTTSERASERATNDLAYVAPTLYYSMYIKYTKTIDVIISELCVKMVTAHAYAFRVSASSTSRPHVRHMWSRISL